MVAVILGVVKLLVVANGVPAVSASYQTTFPALAVAFSVTVPASQRLFGAVDETVGVGVTVAVTAVLGDVQVAVAAST